MHLFKKTFIFSSCIALLSAVLPLSVSAQDIPSITIVNHFNKPLLITKHLNPEALPDLQEEFTLAANGEVSSKVIDIEKRAYVRVEDGEGHSGYWGIKVKYNQSDIHGYYSKGIAFSWNKTKIVFCTPEEYKQNNKNSCL